MKKLFLFVLLLFIGIGSFAQTYKVNDRVNIEWKGSWYTGKILDVKSDQYLVSYDGYGAEWNEYVTEKRLKPIGNSVPTKDGIKVVSDENSAPIISYRSVETIWDLEGSKDGKIIVAASSYGNIKILNATDLSLLSEMKIGTDPISSVSISFDGDYIAIGGMTGKVFIYQRTSGIDFVEYAVFPDYFGVSKLQFSPISNELVVSGAPKENYKNTQVDVWNVEEKKLKFNLVKSTNELNNFSDVAYSNDGTKIALGISNKNHGIEIYNAATGKLSLRIPTAKDVVACSFSPDGKQIAAGGTDKAITLWNLATKTAVWKTAWNDETDAYVYGVSFSADGKSIAVCGKGSGKSVKIYNAADGKMKNELGDANVGGNAIWFSSDASFVYLALTTYGDIAKVPVVQRISVPK